MDIEQLRSEHADHWMKAAAIRILTLDAVAAANSGHSGMPMGMADVATVLFEKHLKFNPQAPLWPDRDRFILSAGHGSMLLYSLLYLTGYPDMSLDQIKDFRQLGAITAGHPEYGHAGGIEVTTGPLGQGIANAVGFALAEEMQRARFGRDLVDHYTYVVVGDGCLMEGISQEAISFAGRQKLSRLIVFWDNNNITIDGQVDLACSTDQVARFRASGWEVLEIDGHDPAAIDAAITQAKRSKSPVMIACKTHIALGSSAQDTSKGHGALTDPKLIADARATYGWPSKTAFEVPSDILAQWRGIGKRNAEVYGAWEARLTGTKGTKRSEFKRIFARKVPDRLGAAIRRVKKEASAQAPSLATRKASEMVLNAVNPVMGETVGGSADLSGSNNTKSKDMSVFDIGNRKGRYIHWGIREHGMAAAINGMVLHGGVRAYGGTFFCFTDYARPSMRLAALMEIPSVFVMTHDSIGVGEDGPTHQPVEHLAICRATPNTYTFRPADLVETAECWEIALSSHKTPSVLALTRQNLPTVRTKNTTKNLSSQGGYVLAEAKGPRKAILMASGSEVSIAMEAKEMLEAEGIGTRVVSMPSMELFKAQDAAYRKRVLPAGPVRVAIEAAVRQPWDQWLLGERGREAKADFVGMESFGASAPAKTLFEHFGITAQETVRKVKALLT